MLYNAGYGLVQMELGMVRYSLRIPYYRSTVYEYTQPCLGPVASPTLNVSVTKVLQSRVVVICERTDEIKRGDNIRDLLLLLQWLLEICVVHFVRGRLR